MIPLYSQVSQCLRKPRRGFTLFIALVLTSVTLSLGTALLDIAYKQLVLTSSAKQSQYAFYAADSALECALYWDQRFNAFDFTAPRPSAQLQCDSRAIVAYTSLVNATRRTTTFEVACPAGGTNAQVTVFKDSNGRTTIFANGYNTCVAASPLRIERGIRVQY